MWWRTAVFYHIYPRSFFDSNGDGIGDLKGIGQKLDYIQWLGADAVWISPFYPSPMADFGYDVANYTDVDPIFGTLSDFSSLLGQAHERDLKIIIDFVPNHTSDRHPWFEESRSDRTNPKRDWYIWRDGKEDGSPPNNWLSVFEGQSGWKLDPRTNQYYLHSFLREQPDVNWRNDGLKQAMLDSLRFWLNMGVDGFRIDVSYRSMKDPMFRDNPPNPAWKEGMDPAMMLIEKYNKNIPDIHIFNRMLRSVIEEYRDKVLIGELYLPLQDLVKHYGSNNDEFHLPFNFSLIGAQWTASVVGNLIETYEGLLGPDHWPNWVLGNHDKYRLASRVGRAQTRNALLMLFTIRGTPTLYYGEELGLPNRHIPPELVQDPWEKYAPGLGLGRDPVRTPMLWDSSAHGGFTKGSPWLPVHEDYADLSIEAQTRDPGSTLSFVRELLRIRKSCRALTEGPLEIITKENDLLAFTRRSPDTGLDTLTILNFSDNTNTLPLPEKYKNPGILLETGEGAAKVSAGIITVGGNQGVLLSA